MRHLWKWHFCHTFNISNKPEALKMLVCAWQHTRNGLEQTYRGYSASTLTNLLYKWKKKRELNCLVQWTIKNTCKLQRSWTGIHANTWWRERCKLSLQCQRKKRNKLLHRFIAAVQNPMSSCSKVWMNQKKNPCLSIIQMQIHAHSAALKPSKPHPFGLKTGNS